MDARCLQDKPTEGCRLLPLGSTLGGSLWVTLGIGCTKFPSFGPENRLWCLSLTWSLRGQSSVSISAPLRSVLTGPWVQVPAPAKLWTAGPGVPGEPLGVGVKQPHGPGPSEALVTSLCVQLPGAQEEGALLGRDGVTARKAQQFLGKCQA